MKNLRIGFYVGFETIYSDSIPVKRLDLISNYSKVDILLLLSLLNNYEKFDQVSQTLEWEHHIELLCQLTAKTPTVGKFVFSKLLQYKKELARTKKVPVLFNRLQLLFAINEVLSTPEIEEQPNEELCVENFIKYLLLVNSHILNLQEKYDLKNVDFSDWYIVMATQAEYFLPFTPTLDLCRSIHLTDYFYNSEYGKDFHEFYKTQAERPIVYFMLVYGHLGPIIGRPIYHPPIFEPKTKLEGNILRSLTSEDVPSYNELMLLHAKKNSFVQISDKEWLLLDKTFLMDNVFYKAINSFWFDHLKAKGYSHKDYYSFIGRFYEEYIADILKTCFDNKGIKVLDELKMKNKKEGEIELADFFHKEDKNIFIGEIKSTNFGSGFKYADDQIQNFRNNKKRFKKDFGINQIAKSIIRLINNPEYFDIKEDELIGCTIFPALIFNEKMIKTGFSNLEFQKLLLGELKKEFTNLNWPRHESEKININEIIVNPLTLIHTSDLEIMEIHIIEKSINLWEILENHREEGKLIEPFYLKVFQNASLDYPEHASNKVKNLIKKIEANNTYS